MKIHRDGFARPHDQHQHRINTGLRDCWPAVTLNRCHWLGKAALIRDSEMLLNTLHSPEQVREQLALR
jgi:hypothetical protein